MASFSSDSRYEARDPPRKTRSRRLDIRAERQAHRPPAYRQAMYVFRDDRTMLVMAVAVGFALVCTSILMLRPKVAPLRPGQVARADVVSRIDFTVQDRPQLERARDAARQAQPRVYARAPDPVARLEQRLLGLPRDVAGLSPVQLDAPLDRILDEPSLAHLQDVHATQDETWEAAVRRLGESLRRQNLVLLPPEARLADWQREVRLPSGLVPTSQTLTPVGESFVADPATPPERVAPVREALERRLEPVVADAFSPLIASKMLSLVLEELGSTHVPDEAATAAAKADAAARVPPEAGHVTYRPGQTLVPAGRTVTEDDWQLLRAEQGAFRREALGRQVWAERAGFLGVSSMLTVALGLYVARYQPRVVKNPTRALGMAAMLAGALLVAQLAGLGTGNLALLGVAPVVLVAMTLSVAYDGRFALGVGGILALLVTLALGEGLGYFFVLFAGLLTACFLLGEVRSRSKLIEVGGLTGVSLGIAAVVAGLLRMDPVGYTLLQGAYAGLAGIVAGGIVLCVLPFIEKVFHVTTGLTLLEYQSHPLLRRLALEASGTYNHSLQVAALAEEAASAVGADALLCRVAAYYHDIGKLRKPDYFIENQSSGENRHLNLNPSMSLLVIINHVKDGVEMAREYGLPRAFVPFIQQHHGTTLVEYFYREACERQRQKLAESAGGDACDRGTGHVPADVPDRPVDADDYRYPGPRPRTRETAIVMLADTCESACRAMADPTPTRIESRVNDLVQKRLLDGQFDDCGMTLRDLELIRKTLVKTLVGIYHGRIQYPGEAGSDTTSPDVAPLVLPSTQAG